MKDNKEIAADWRKNQGDRIKTKGFVLISAGRATGWSLDLPKPQFVLPGIVAVDQDGQEFVAIGENKEYADSWTN